MRNFVAGVLFMFGRTPIESAAAVQPSSQTHGRVRV
jgi:hypothetical protein